MHLIERLGASEAAAAGVLGSANAAYFAGYACSRRNAGHRPGALALVVVNLALALESALYLAFIPQVADGAHAVAAFAGRGALLLADGTVSALIVRRHSRPGGPR